MAPEVVSRKGHDISADWWSYGVLMYESKIPAFHAAPSSAHSVAFVAFSLRSADGRPSLHER